MTLAILLLLSLSLILSVIIYKSVLFYKQQLWEKRYTGIVYDFKGNPPTPTVTELKEKKEAYNKLLSTIESLDNTVSFIKETENPKFPHTVRHRKNKDSSI